MHARRPDSAPSRATTLGGALLLTLPFVACSDSGSVAPAPELRVLSSTAISVSVQAGANAGGQAVTLANAGAGALRWVAASGAAWLSVSPASGTLAGGENTTVVLDLATAPLAAGDYTGTVTFTPLDGNGVSRSVTVSLTVTAPPGRLAAAPTSLTATATAGVAPPAQTLQLSNPGGQPLTWSASTNQPWLSVSPATGTLAPGATATLTVNYTTAALAAGSYAAVLTVAAPTASNTPLTVPVALSVNPAPPTLALSASVLADTTGVGTSPAARTVQLTNSGGQPLTWNATTNQSWLSVSPAQGTLAAGASVTLTVSYATSALPAGGYSGLVGITSAGAVNSPQQVAASVIVEPPAGELTLSVATLARSIGQGLTPAAQTFTVTNTGGRPLSWSAADNQGWLSVSPATGTLAPGASAQLTVTYATGALAIGSYAATITVSAPGANGGARTVAVSLSVTVPQPVITLAPEFLSRTTNVGTSPAPQQFTITNSGGQPLAWTAMASDAWLTVLPASGTLESGASATVTVTYSTASLSVATWAGTVIVTGAGAANTPQVVNVSVTVGTQVPIASSISLTPASVALTAVTQSAQLTATVRDQNGQPLVSQPALQFTSSAPGVVSVTPGGLVTAIAPGTAQVTVSLPGTGLSATTSVTVTQVLSTVSLTPTSATLGVNGTQQLTATARDANGEALVTQPTFTWNSSNPAVATVSSTGLVTARAAGTTTISVFTAGAPSASATITVTAPSTGGASGGGRDGAP